MFQTFGLVMQSVRMYRYILYRLHASRYAVNPHFPLGGRMKVRNNQSDLRRNPDSTRVHGLRLAVNTQPSRSEGQTGNSAESNPPPSGERASLPVSSRRDSNQITEPLLDCNAAATVLGGLHPKTVERWAREGRIPAYRYCRHWRFRVSDLEVWIRSPVHSSCHPCRLQEKSDGT
jgi:excisionase family DNA binding protein